MQVEKTERGFQILKHPPYIEDRGSENLVQQSSIIGNYPEAMERPGTSALWIGRDHHLNREEVSDLIGHLNCWLNTGKLA